MPDGTSRFKRGNDPIYHFMGTSTFANYTVLPEIAVAKIRKDAPFDKVCLIGCGVTTGIGAVINTAKVEPGANVVVFGLGGVGLSVIQGATMAGANMIVGVDTNPGKRAMAEQFGMTHFVNPSEVEGDLVPYIVDLTGGGPTTASRPSVTSTSCARPSSAATRGGASRSSSVSPVRVRRSRRAHSSW